VRGLKNPNAAGAILAWESLSDTRGIFFCTFFSDGREKATNGNKKGDSLFNLATVYRFIAATKQYGPESAATITNLFNGTGRAYTGGEVDTSLLRSAPSSIPKESLPQGTSS
jgi:hypothetical protein